MTFKTSPICVAPSPSSRGGATVLALLGSTAISLIASSGLAQTTAAQSAVAANIIATTAVQPTQPQAASVQPLDEGVVVTADAYANTKAIATKRDLAVVSDGISANQIGELPEFGLGDALSSVPGVTFVINNGRGEDQFMTIRGLNPDYNSVTIDGIVLPSTEETTRSVSFDVLPASIVSQANVLKTWTVDQPSDAVGGVTDLRTRSAFDHPGTFVSGQLDGAYWEDQRQLHSNVPSGEADFIASKTFGPKDEFGALILLSYYQRDSSTVNTYDLPYSYYTASGAALPPTSGTTTASSQTLLPSAGVAGDLAIPDRHQWYFYDNVRTRPGLFGRFDFDDHHMWHAHLTGGIFRFKNDESRYSQYLNQEYAPAVTTPTTGSVAKGLGEAQFDKYIQYRELAYVDFGVGADLGPRTHVDFTADYGYGHYRQTTAEDAFTEATSSTLAYDYNLAAESGPLFTPVNDAYFMNPADYKQSYHLNEVDQSKTTQPTFRLDFNHNFRPEDRGFGFSAGAQYRDLSQSYTYTQFELLPTVAPTLAQTGVLGSPSLYDGYGQTVLTVSDAGAVAYINANPSNYTRSAGDLRTNIINNYDLDETVTDGYAQADYRAERVYTLLGVRYETTGEKIQNYLPEPFSSTTNFVQTTTDNTYSKLLPSLNVSCTPVDTIVFRGAVTETLARPEYGQLAENSSASITSNASGGVASETVSNPSLKPREATNYDLSLEYYPVAGALASLAVFEKDIKNEIITLTTTETNVTIPGQSGLYNLTLTEPENANKSRVRGVELNLLYSRFTFLPGFLSGFGARGNIAFMNYDAPYIRMSDGTLRHLPQLISSAHEVANAALFYAYGHVIGEVSYNHTGKQPISFDTNNAVNDQWWAAIDTVDAQLRYVITRNLDVRVQFKNLLDSRPQKVVGPNQGLNYSTLENGRAYFFGVGYHF